MRQYFALLTAVSAACLLSACLVPERFTALVNVQPDGSYSYSYEGSAVDSFAVMKLKQQGSLSDADQRGLAEQARQLHEDPDVRKAVYHGNARYTLEVSGQRSKGESLKLMDMFTVQTDPEGIMTIAAKPLQDKEKREFEQLGINVKGILKVRIPHNADVIFQNATSSPTTGAGSYSWKIGGLRVRPEIRLRLKP